MKERIVRKTLNFRWIIRDSEKILQQQIRESDTCFIDWQGDNPKYWWEDVPVEKESKEEV